MMHADIFSRVYYRKCPQIIPNINTKIRSDEK